MFIIFFIRFNSVYLVYWTFFRYTVLVVEWHISLTCATIWNNCFLMRDFHLWCYDSHHLNILHSLSFSHLFHWEPWLSFCLLYTSWYFFTNSFLFTHFVDPYFLIQKIFVSDRCETMIYKIKKMCKFKGMFSEKSVP